MTASLGTALVQELPGSAGFTGCILLLLGQSSDTTVWQHKAHSGDSADSLELFCALCLLASLFSRPSAGCCTFVFTSSLGSAELPSAGACTCSYSVIATSPIHAALPQLTC